MTSKKIFTTLALTLCITFISLAQVGIGITTPNSSAALDISSTTKGLLLPRMTAAQRDLISVSASETSLMIYCTNCGTNGEPQFYNGTAWVNLVGNYAATAILAVGDSHEGGKIAYLFVLGDPGFIAGEQHGLIAASSDQSTGSPWGCSGTSISTTTATGTGNQNTINIMTRCSTEGIAARLCGDLVLNGYSDWYLPSQNELSIIRNNRVAIGNFNNLFYWSSTQSSSNQAIRIRMDSGGISNFGKTGTQRVRAVRTF